MPKRRLTLEEAADEVKKVITARGGKVSYADLVAQLEADGNESAVSLIRAVVQTGGAKSEVQAQPAGKPIVYYTL